MCNALVPIFKTSFSPTSKTHQYPAPQIEIDHCNSQRRHGMLLQERKRSCCLLTEPVIVIGNRKIEQSRTQGDATRCNAMLAISWLRISSVQFSSVPYPTPRFPYNVFPPQSIIIAFFGIRTFKHKYPKRVGRTECIHAVPNLFSAETRTSGPGGGGWAFSVPSWLQS